MPFGQALAAHAFDVMTPAGVVAIRQLVTALVLIPVVRPPIRRLTWNQWWPVLTLGFLFVAMNLTLSIAIDRIGVTLALTLEFLGPLCVALAGSRSARDVACAIAAGLGVYILILPDRNSDLLGIAAGLAAAACWATYILLNRTLGRRLPGLQATALASSFSTILCLPMLAWLVFTGRFTGTPLLLACVAGVLSSIVPYVADLLALRRVPAQLFAITMSLNPIFAAAAGVLVLDEQIEVHQWIGILVIVSANVVTGRSASRRTPRRRNGGPGHDRRDPLVRAKVGQCRAKRGGERRYQGSPSNG